MAKRIDILFGSHVDDSGAISDIKSIQKSFKNLKITPKIDDSFLQQFQKTLKIVKDEATKLNTLTATASSNGITYNITQKQSRNHQYYPATFTIDEEKSLSTVERNLKTLYRNAIDLQNNINTATKSGLTTYVANYKEALEQIKSQISEVESSFNILGGNSSTDNRLSRLKSTLESVALEGEVAEQTKNYKELDLAIENLTDSEEKLAKAKANMNSESTINTIQKEVDYWKKEIDAITSAESATQELIDRAQKGVEESSLNANSVYATSKEKAATDILIEYKKQLKEVSRAEIERAQLIKQSDTAQEDEKNTITQLVSLLDQTIAKRKENINTLEEELRDTGLYTQALEKREEAELQTEKAILKINSASEKNINLLDEMKARVAQTVEEFLTFGIVNSLFSAIRQSITKTIETIKELNEAMTNVQMVTEGTDAETQKLASQYSDLAKELGATTTEIANGASEWLRQGKTVEETTQLLRASMTLSKVGAIESSEATELLTSTLNGYKLEASDAMNVVDALSRVDLVAATSAEELAEALQHTANMARVNGVGFNDLVGMIGAVSEVTRRSASIVGNSFKTIFSRLTNIAAGKDIDDEGESINDVEQSLERVGIRLRDDNNEWRNMYDVISEIASRWSEFSSLEQSQISTAVAGTRQRETWLSLMENWDRAQTLSLEAENSLGSASQKMEVYTDSIAGNLKSLQAAFEDLVYTQGTQDLFKSIIKSAENLVSIIDYLANNSAVRVLAVSSTLTLAFTKISQAWKMIGNAEALSSASRLMKLFVSFLSSIKTGGQNVASIFGSAATAIGTFIENISQAISSGAGLSGVFTVLGTSIKSASAALLSSPFVIVTAVVAGVSIIKNVIDDMTVSLEEAEEALENTNSKIEELQNEYENLSNKTSLNDSEKERLKLLEAQLGVLKRQREEEEKSVSAVKVKNAVLGNYEEVGISDYSGNRSNYNEAYSQLKPDSYNSGANGIYGIVDVKAALLDLEMYNQQLKEIDISAEGAADQWDEITKKQDEASAFLLEWASLIDEVEDSGYKLSGDMAQIAEMLDSSQIFAELLEGNLEGSSEIANELGESADDIATALEEANASITSSMSTLSEGMDLIDSLEEEVSEYGNISLDTLNSLIDKYPTLIDVVTEYLTGLASTSDILNALQEAYAVDQENLYNSLLAKLQMQEDYYSQLYGADKNLLAAFSEDYGFDLQNNLNKNEAKLEMEQQVVNALSQMWSKYYGEELKNIEQVLSVMESGNMNLNSPLGAKAYNLIKNYNEAIERMNQYDDSFLKKIQDSFTGIKKATAEMGKTSSSVSSAESEQQEAYNDLLEMTIAMLKKKKELEKESLQEQLDDYKKLINARKELLDEQQDEYDHKKELEEKNKTISDLEAKIAEIQFDTSAEGTKKRLELEEELAAAREELEDYQHDYSIDQQKDALDKEEDRFSEYIDNQVDEIEEYLSKTGEIEAEAIRLINERSEALFNDLIQYNRTYGDSLDQTVINAWYGAVEAVNSYKSALDSAAASAANLSRYTSSVSSMPSISTKTKIDPDLFYVLTGNDVVKNVFSTFKEAFAWADKYGYDRVSAGDALIKRGITEYHKGINAGFVGNIKGNEEFVKALKGEVFVTKQQQDKFMNSLLPKIVASSAINNIGKQVSFGNLLNLTVQGNLDSSTVPKIETIVKQAVDTLNKTMQKNGFIRSTNSVSI